MRDENEKAFYKDQVDLYEVYNLDEKIRTLQDSKIPLPELDHFSIRKIPSDSQVRQGFILTGILSLFAGIFSIFFVEYIGRIWNRRHPAPENKQ